MGKTEIKNAGARASGAPAPEETEDRFKLLVESIVDYGIFMLDLDGRVSSWNVGAERMKGYTAREVIGQHFSIFYSREEVAAGKCESELESARRDGRFEREGFRLRKDGTPFWANVVITSIRNSEGVLVGLGTVTRDLTERRTAEEELSRSEERMRLLISSVKDYAIFVLDPSGHVATWNPGAERLKGYSTEEIVGQHFSRFYPESDTRARKCDEELEIAQAQGRFEEEGFRVRKDGSQFWANVVITPIRQESGALVGFAKVTRDLTERKRSEEERITLARAEEGRRIAESNQALARAHAAHLARARDEAVEATRMKDDFLATVSHELRTPLNAILGWARMLQAGSLPAEKTARAIDTIVRNATAQKQLIDDLLDVSRIITGQLRLDVEAVDMNQIVSAAVEVVRPGAEAKGIALHVSSDPDIGVIQGDAGRLQQVFWNLLTNAMKFTPKGGTIRVTIEPEGASVAISVIDTGKGIGPEFLPHVFERFAQQDTSNSRKVGGLGLGLAIVKHLVELHGGNVDARSAGEGAGSTFVVRLPFLPQQGSHREAERRSVPFEDAQLGSQLQGLKLLVVDDEPDAGALAQEILQQAGAAVTRASSGAEALEMIRLEKPDVIVSDIGMPEEDGYVFIRKLRALPEAQGGHIPAIALTAFARADDRRKALLAGFQNHAAKPIEPLELISVIANLAGRYT